MFISSMSRGSFKAPIALLLLCGCEAASLRRRQPALRLPPSLRIQNSAFSINSQQWL